ncbi:ribonuclease HII, partial [bacterium]|nr:ribonuclease HII [bacterium]
IARENIIGASFLAMRRALDRLTVEPVFLLVDGPAQRLHFPRLRLPAIGIVKGDSKVASIAAASILAKTARDEVMARYDELFPGYGFARNKGYGKPALDALKRLGATPIHRYSWSAVQQLELG